MKTLLSIIFDEVSQNIIYNKFKMIKLFQLSLLYYYKCIFVWLSVKVGVLLKKTVFILIAKKNVWNINE